MRWEGLAEVLSDICEREGWVFHAPDPNAVTAFEHSSGVSVPEPYRSFLLEVSSGMATDCMQLERFASDEAARPSEPFPYDRAYGDSIITALGEGRTLDELAADPAFAVRQVHGLPPGCLVVGELDGMLCVLALSGEEAGYVWRVGDFDLPETRHAHEPQGDDGRMEFGRWFMEWLVENGLEAEVTKRWDGNVNS